MKRLHVHASVKDLSESVRFYSALFAAEPTVLKADYAKWMLDDPRVNFAISTRSEQIGINHLGIQAESAEELAQIESRARDAELDARAESGGSCCYARSDKHWLTDPQGIVWEAFHTLGDIPVYGSDVRSEHACHSPEVSSAAAKSAAVAACGTASNCC
jgi:catechol 2,3-dioxygenase-like lactoylglutathione lyase family enzyme